MQATAGKPLRVIGVSGGRSFGQPGRLSYYGNTCTSWNLVVPLLRWGRLLFEQRLETGLLEVMVGRESVVDAFIFHHDKGDAVG